MILPAEPPRTRPATVTAAFGLQVGLIAVLLFLIALTAVEAVIYDGLIDDAARLTDADPAEVRDERAFNVEFAVITSVPPLLLVLLYAATAFPVRSGRSVARILTCVAAGLPLPCCLVACGLGALAVIPPSALDDPARLEEEGLWPDDSAFYEKLYDLQSTGAASALDFVLPSLTSLALALSIAIAVLLLVPPSNRYFRPPARLQPLPAYPFTYPVPPGYLLVPPAPAEPPTPPAPDDKPPDTDSAPG